MNLQQILTEAKTLVPPGADITDDMLVLKANQIQRRVYRQLVLPDKVVAFLSTPGIPFYDLPTDCAEDRVKNVMIDNINYPKLSVEENSPPDRFCSVMLNKLYIFPNPSNPVNIFIYYRPRYHDLSASNLSDVPDLSEDYHELLVFGLAQWMAKTQGDIDVANNNQADFDELLMDAKKEFRQMTANRVRVKDRW
ncbi:hypothetical protein [Paenibacillus oryzisoli]|uniref:Uncharacterized protein n=1 Tax=Paenibacillus oryzisoli TaxID=1850517 RepID=A0A198ADI6_9BACL|nr:hypothetical protein [Paenibacillus oryzisoli]OAS19247.1 hypothetical protein A8708_26410 [Paenibacillus oryzisoli]